MISLKPGGSSSACTESSVSCAFWERVIQHKPTFQNKPLYKCPTDPTAIDLPSPKSQWNLQCFPSRSLVTLHLLNYITTVEVLTIYKGTETIYMFIFSFVLSYLWCLVYLNWTLVYFPPGGSNFAQVQAKTSKAKGGIGLLSSNPDSIQLQEENLTCSVLRVVWKTN